MTIALQEAAEAARAGEVPVGAVIVCDGQVVVKARNRREEDESPTAHAEILAIGEAANKLGRWRLTGCTIYVTKEPCPMCAGAMVQARLDRLVYGAPDSKAGAAGTLFDIVRDPRLNHQLEVTAGVREEECRRQLQAFFEARR